MGEYEDDEDLGMMEDGGWPSLEAKKLPTSSATNDDKSHILLGNGADDKFNANSADDEYNVNSHQSQGVTVRSRKKRKIPDHPNVESPANYFALTTSSSSNSHKRGKRSNAMGPISHSSIIQLDMSEEASNTNERVGLANKVLHRRAMDDFKLSLAIVCHFKPDILPKQYRFPFTTLSDKNITPELIIEGYRLPHDDILRFEQYINGNPMQHTHIIDVTNDEDDDPIIEDEF